MTEANLASTRDRRPGRRRAVVAGLAAALAIAGVPLLGGLGDDSSGRIDRHITNDEALTAVRAAVGNTVASGSYETDFDTHSTYPTVPASQQCPRESSCPIARSTSTFESSGHGTVNFDPYVSLIVTNSSYGPRTLYVTSTTVWLSTGGTVGTGGPGIPLSAFASSVESALGPSQGALSMIGLASPGGSLNLEQEAVAGAAPAGSGSVDGANVTYYDVTIDMTKLADTPDLTDVQRDTIQAALPLLRQGGYTGTTERVGVDDAGYIREVTATNHFADGSTGTRHTVLSNFGCAARVSPPDQIASPVTTTRPCTPPPSTTNSLAPPSTSAPPASTTTNSVTPTTTSPPPTSTTTLPKPTTTPAPEPPTSSTATTSP
jgi:hypothetical protein